MSKKQHSRKLRRARTSAHAQNKSGLRSPQKTPDPLGAVPLGRILLPLTRENMYATDEELDAKYGRQSQ